MKHKSTIRYILLVGMVVLLLVGLILFYAASKNEGRYFLRIPAAVLCGLGGIIFIYLISTVIFDAAKDAKRREAYLSYPLNPINDYKAELNQIRINFTADTNPEKNRVLGKYQSADAWAKPFYDNHAIDVGEIYYAVLVQANGKLFQKKKTNPVLPGVVIYSTDEYFESDPNALKKIANALYADKAFNDLRFEDKFYTPTPLSTDLTDGRRVFISSVMIARKHLPQYKLTGQHTILPVIAAPQKSTSVFVADCKYWTNDLIAQFLNESL